jgi:hypothetical protein
MVKLTFDDDSFFRALLRRRHLKPLEPLSDVCWKVLRSVALPRLAQLFCHAYDSLCDCSSVKLSYRLYGNVDGVQLLMAIDERVEGQTDLNFFLRKIEE